MRRPSPQISMIRGIANRPANLDQLRTAQWQVGHRIQKYLLQHQDRNSSSNTSIMSRKQMIASIINIFPLIFLNQWNWISRATK